MGSCLVVTGPLAPFLAGFESRLAELGYSRSAARKQVQLSAHLSGWLDGEGIGLASLATDRVEGFFTARRAAGYANLRTRRSAAPLVDHLREIGAIGLMATVSPVDPGASLVDRFATYLGSERGLVEGTIRGYVRVASAFVAGHIRDGRVDFDDLAASDVMAFVTVEGDHLGLSATRHMVSALRSFLRFVFLEGIVGRAFEEAVWSVAGSAPLLPRSVDGRVVQRLLDSGCDRRTSMGRRDYAMLVLLSRLGLRSGEVAGLELDDIDWRAGEIVVRGKGARTDRLPLPADVGQAIASYLQRGRPASDSRRVILRCCAPFVGLADTGAIRSMLARACERAGVDYVCPHRLRHTVATAMLATGSSLGEIGEVLRHSGIASTAIYASVDRDRLAELARPWPGGAK